MLRDLVSANKVCMGKSKETSGNEYSVVLKYNGNSITMLYHDNYKNESDKDNFLYALLLDGLAYENCYNLADFMDEFGYDYDNLDKAKKAYKACERQCEKLYRLFTHEEIEQLQVEFEDFQSKGQSPLVLKVLKKDLTSTLIGCIIDLTNKERG